MISFQPIKVLFRVGHISVWSYGFMLFLSFALGSVLALLEVRRKRLDVFHMLGIIIMLMIGSMAGARAIYYMEHVDRFLAHPGNFFDLQRGGLSAIGGFVGGFVSVYIYLKVQKLDVWSYVDAVVPSVCLGIFLTRIGCFLNGCCSGKASSLPWAVNVGDFPRHPTQLYLSLNGLLLFILFMVLRKRGRYAGMLFPLFLVVYGSVRFLIEFLRDSARYALDLTAAQLSIVPLVLISLLCLLKAGRFTARVPHE